jgi:hypothetical protein
MAERRLRDDDEIEAEKHLEQRWIERWDCGDQSGFVLVGMILTPVAIG